MSDIITSARSHIGTRFLHQGRLKKTENHKGGLDCLGLLVSVARECYLRSKTGELLADVDEFNYPHYPDTIRLRQMLSAHLQEVAVGSWQLADIALFEIDGRAQHMGIISPSPTGGGLGWGHYRHEPILFQKPLPTPAIYVKT